MTLNIRSFVGLVLLGLMDAAAAPGQDPPPSQDAPPENPPGILVAATIDDADNLVLVEYRTIYIGFTGESYNHRSLTRVPLNDVQIMTVGGDAHTIDSARKQLGGQDAPVLVSSWKSPLPKFYAAMFTPQTLHFVFPKKAPAWRPIQGPGTPVRR